MTNKKITISADDFGISQKANDNILKLIELKKIDRVSIMTNGIFSPAEISRLITSEIELDIHLDLDKLSKKTAKRKIKKSILGRSFSFLLLYFSGKIGAASAEISWENQFVKFEEIFGKKPAGANSHQHIHFFPAYLKVLLKICKNNNITYLRFGKNRFEKNFNPICLILNALRLKGLKNFLQSGISTSDFLVSLDWLKNIQKFSQNPSQKNIELICHPEREQEFEIIKKYF